MSTDLVELGSRIAKDTGHYAGGSPHDFEIVGRHIPIITHSLVRMQSIAAQYGLTAGEDGSFRPPQ